MATLTLALFSHPLYAATASDARGVTTITPGALEDRLAQPAFTTPLAKPKKITVPADQQSVPTQAEKIIFTLKAVNITGAPIYSKNALLPFYKQYLGKEISLAKLYEIADKITQKLRQDGYVISKAYIPPQHISNGEAEIRIIGGYIDEVSFKGDKVDYDMRFLNAYAQKILASRPLKLQVLERYALLMNDLPGITSRVVLSPSDTTPDAAHLTFFIAKKAVSGYASYDNRGTLYTGPQEIALGGSVDTLIAGGKVGVHTAAATRMEELKYGQLYWDQYIGTDGLQLNVNASQTISRPKFDLSDLDIKGVTDTYGAGFNYPLIRNHSVNWFINTNIQGFDTRSVTQFDDSLLYKDTIRTLSVGTTYNVADRFLGSNSAEFTYTRGLPLFSYTHANTPADEPSTRTKGNAVFTKYTLLLSRLQGLPKRFSALFSVEGQASRDRLLSSQEFNYGGSQFGLGYDSSELLGDQGAAGRAELRWDSPSFKLIQTQLFTSYDFGAVWHQEPLNVDEPKRQTGSSIAAGIRLGWTQYFSASLTIARPLTLQLPENIARGDSRRPWRGFFTVTLQY